MPRFHEKRRALKYEENHTVGARTGVLEVRDSMSLNWLSASRLNFSSWLRLHLWCQAESFRQGRNKEFARARFVILFGRRTNFASRENEIISIFRTRCGPNNESGQRLNRNIKTQLWHKRALCKYGSVGLFPRSSSRLRKISTSPKWNKTNLEALFGCSRAHGSRSCARWDRKRSKAEKRRRRESWSMRLEKCLMAPLIDQFSPNSREPIAVRKEVKLHFYDKL